MRMYRYMVIENDLKVYGHLIAKDIVAARRIINRHYCVLIYVYRVWFFTFNRLFVVEWFGSLNKLIRSGLNIGDAIRIVGQGTKIDISLNIVDCFCDGKSFSSSIVENRLFFGDESCFIAKHLSEYIGVEDLCMFLEEYNNIILKNVKEINKQIFLPVVSLFGCVMVLFGVLWLFISNIDIIMYCTSDKNKLYIKCIRMIHSFGLVKFFIFFLFCFFVFFRFVVMRSGFILRYYLAKESSFVFYVIDKYISYGFHLIECFNILLSTLNKGQLSKEISLIKRGLINGKHLTECFKCCDYLSKYAYMVNIYESSGMVDKIFFSLSRLEEDEVLKMINFLQHFLPLILFGFAVVCTMITCVFVCFGLMNVSFFI